MTSRALRSLSGLLGLSLLAALVSGCYPGYDIIQPAPPHLRGRGIVVLEPAEAGPQAKSVVANALARQRKDASANAVDAWLNEPLIELHQGCAEVLAREGFQVLSPGEAPSDPGTYVRAKVLMTNCHFGSTAGRVLGAIFGTRHRNDYPWIQTHVFLYDPAQPQVFGQAQVHYEYRSTYTHFHRITRPAGQRSALFLRDSLLVQR